MLASSQTGEGEPREDASDLLRQGTRRVEVSQAGPGARRK